MHPTPSCRAALAASRGLRGRLPLAHYLIATAAAERSFGAVHPDSLAQRATLTERLNTRVRLER